MGLLDELRQESESVKDRESAEKERAKKLNEIYDTEVIPKIEMIYRYLQELEEHLNYLKPDIPVDYEMPGFGMMEDLKQCEYGMEKGRREVLKQVPFKFVCKSNGNVNFRVDGVKKLNGIMQELDRAGIRFTCKKIRSGNNDVVGGDLEVVPAIPVTFMFEGDLELSGINLTISNYDNLFTTTTFLKPEQITDEFLDELGKYILRKPSIFLKSTIDDEKRAQIQNMVREAEMRRQKELKDAELREQEELLAVKDSTLLARLKKRIQKQ